MKVYSEAATIKAGYVWTTVETRVCNWVKAGWGEEPNPTTKPFFTTGAALWRNGLCREAVRSLSLRVLVSDWMKL